MVNRDSVMKTGDTISFIFFLLCCLILFFVPTGFEGSQAKDSYIYKAVVISVDNSDLRRNLIVYTGIQDIQAQILKGPHKDTITRVSNPLSGKLEFDEIYKEGDMILIEYKVHKGKIHMAFSRGHYRLGHEYFLIFLFGFFIILIAGVTGIKALLSFVFAALMIWKILIPLFLKDVNPISVTIGVAAGLTASVSFLIGGCTRKGLTAFLGAFSGLLLACIMAELFSPGFRLNGAVKPYAENLLYGGFPHLDLTKIFLAGIFLACSGAVMDLAMDIAASMNEIKNKKPDIGFGEIFKSGMNVGRSVVGTMTTTLLLAYSGGYTAMLMNFMGQGLQFKQILNMNLVASEILNVFVGSFGLVAVAPLTSLFGAIIYSRKKY